MNRTRISFVMAMSFPIFKFLISVRYELSEGRYIGLSMIVSDKPCGFIKENKVNWNGYIGNEMEVSRNVTSLLVFYSLLLTLYQFKFIKILFFQLNLCRLCLFRCEHWVSKVAELHISKDNCYKHYSQIK